MKVKRILASVFSGVVLIGGCIGMVGCKKLDYNAKKLTGVEYSKEFLEENRIGGVYYLDLETLDWNKTAPGPVLPQEVVDKTAKIYKEAYRMLSGKSL